MHLSRDGRGLGGVACGGGAWVRRYRLYEREPEDPSSQGVRRVTAVERGGCE